MKKNSVTLFFFQLLTSTIVLMAEANTVSCVLAKSKDEPTDIREMEIEANRTKDVFPDLITFAMHIYQ
jgi:hypothetical protein